MAAVLTISSNGYGYHRDELYFRMLDPAWGYVDQPPLTPLLVRAASSISDNVWAIRVPSTLAAAFSVLVLAKLIQEFGGGRFAQTGGAWAYAFASLPLAFGHIMLTASMDLVVWPAIALMAVRALRRDEPRWWLAAGAIVGLSTYNKLLVGLLVLSLIAGLLLVGPRKVLWSRYFILGAGLAVLLAVPNLLYQFTHDWPQFTMGAALRENNADEVRGGMWLFLLLMLGPPLVAVWGTGLVALFRNPDWRPIRFLAVAFPLLLILTFIAGGQNYYPLGLMTVLFAAGCAPLGEWLARSGVAIRSAAAALVVINALAASVISLPLLPVAVLGNSPIPDINESAADQVGWPAYVDQIAAVYSGLPAQDQTDSAIITSNYGEAGAVDRFGPELGLPAPYSGHNELYFRGAPPSTTKTAIIVGSQIDNVRDLFGSCEVLATLDNGVGVDNEEQGQQVNLCRDPIDAWDVLWPQFLHYD